MPQIPDYNVSTVLYAGKVGWLTPWQSRFEHGSEGGIVKNDELEET